MRDEKVVFIRGSGRCGSKNLVTHLGQHPALAHVPVNQVLPEELIDWTRHRLQVPDPRVSDEAVAAACRAYFAAYGRTLAGTGGSLLQKSTMNAHHLGTLLEYWPEAKVIYLVRHPLGWVEALLNADIHDYAGLYGYEAAVADSAMRWCSELWAYLRSPAFGHPRLLQVYFEDLVGDPRRTVGAICRFLDIEDLSLPPYGGPEVFDKPFALDQTERRWIIESTTEVVERLGYNPDDWTSVVPSENESWVESYPHRRLHAIPPALDAVELLRRALAEAAQRGYKRVGLFGAGYFARLACSHLDDSPVEIACVFDENPTLRNSQIAAFSIRTPDAASELGVEAVIPTTFVHQDKLIQRWRETCDRRISVVPLWNDERVDPQASCATSDKAFPAARRTRLGSASSGTRDC